MPTIKDYLDQLDTDKETLVSNLTEKGVEASSEETFTTLVPKVRDIETGGGDVDEQIKTLINNRLQEITNGDFTATVGTYNIQVTSRTQGSINYQKYLNGTKLTKSYRFYQWIQATPRNHSQWLWKRTTNGFSPLKTDGYGYSMDEPVGLTTPLKTANDFLYSENSITPDGTKQIQVATYPVAYTEYYVVSTIKNKDNETEGTYYCNYIELSIEQLKNALEELVVDYINMELGGDTFVGDDNQNAIALRELCFNSDAFYEYAQTGQSQYQPVYGIYEIDEDNQELITVEEGGELIYLLDELRYKYKETGTSTMKIFGADSFDDEIPNRKMLFYYDNSGSMNMDYTTALTIYNSL